MCGNRYLLWQSFAIYTYIIMLHTLKLIQCYLSIITQQKSNDKNDTTYYKIYLLLYMYIYI